MARSRSRGTFLLGGGDLARCQDVVADAPVLELVESDAGPGLLDGLAAGVDAPAGEGAEGGVGASHEDGAAVVEERGGLLDGEEGAAGVEPEPVSNCASVISPSDAGSPPALVHSTSRLPLSRLRWRTAGPGRPGRRYRRGHR